jgi:NAD(P)-dependent dehydrogenase (short-subunit alcohol dehydrogenase family)
MADTETAGKAAHEAAVVTGASAGIGAAVARSLLERGLTVVTLQRTAPKFSDPNLHFRAVDLTNAQATREAAAHVAAEFPVHYLVNNAGASRLALLEDATIDDLQHVTALTLGSSMLLMQAFVPGMRRAGVGRIVNMSSRAIMGKTSRTVYASAKAGLIGMTRAVARAVLFLLDRDEGFITGQALFVCGGTSVTGTGGA